MLSLYDLNSAYVNILALMDDGLLTEDDAKVSLEQIQEDIEIKLEQLARAVKNLEAEASGYDGEIKRMTDRKRALENRAKWFKLQAEAAMRLHGKQKVKGEYFSLSIQKNPPSLKSTPDLDPKKLPEHYQIHTVTPNSAAIKQAIKDGQEVQGFWLEQGESLRIR